MAFYIFRFGLEHQFRHVDVERALQLARLAVHTVIDHAAEIIVAEMTVAYKVIRETFTSRAVFDTENLQILVDYLDGPFKHMENRWTFVPNGERCCMVRFSIDYEFKTRALGLVMGAMFDKAFRKFAEAFEARADAVYGR